MQYNIYSASFGTTYLRHLNYDGSLLEVIDARTVNDAGDLLGGDVGLLVGLAGDASNGDTFVNVGNVLSQIYTCTKCNSFRYLWYVIQTHHFSQWRVSAHLKCYHWFKIIVDEGVLVYK